MRSGGFDPIDAVLFDLDGTLADTAPDLAAAANHLRLVRGLPSLPLATLRPVASHGARGLLRVAFDITPDEPGYEALRCEFIDTYERAICVFSELFPGMHELLDDLERRGVPWGVVTNKATRLTLPLAGLLGIAGRAACLVCGDTTPYSKPHPQPLLEAARLLQVDPQRCVYIGDDERDIAAGQAAGMATLAAAYGYTGTRDPHSWGANAVVARPSDILPLLASALRVP